MRSFRVRFHKDDGTFVAEFVVQATLDGEAIELATELFHVQFPEEAVRPFEAHCSYA